MDAGVNLGPGTKLAADEPVSRSTKGRDAEMVAASSVVASPVSTLPSTAVAAPTPTAPTTEPRHVAPEVVLNQVAKALKAVVKEKSNEVVLRLDPPDMGHIKVRLTSEMGGLSASFHAESNAVKAVLETNLPALHTALNEAGVSVQQMSIFAGSEFNSSGRQSDNAPAPSRRRNAAPSSESTDTSQLAPVTRQRSRRLGALDLFA
jgi:flagellar hook-length control protein FliK